MLTKSYISFCTTCMNRLHHLQKTLIRNIKDNTDYDRLEFVLLDYNSSDGLAEYVDSELREYIENGRLKYYRTEDPAFYNMSHSRNIAFKLAEGEIVCNIDADNFTGSGFAAYVNSVFQKYDNVFLNTQSNKLVKKDVLGRICVKKEHFLQVGGYDEKMLYYGFDDYDFANRLSLSGVRRFSINNHKYLRALEHSNFERMQNIPESRSLYKLLIQYQTPAESVVILLYDNGCYKRATMRNNYIYNAIGDETKDKVPTQFKFSIKEDFWEEGNWSRRKEELSLKNKTGASCYFVKAQDNWHYENQSFVENDNTKLHELVLFFYNQVSNRIIMDNNLKSNTVRVNEHGFGTASVTKNFSYQLSI